MPNESEKLKEEKKEREIGYPPIPAGSWFEAEHHVIENHSTDPIVDEDKVAVKAYSAMRHFGHLDYMSKREAIALGVSLLKLLAPEKLSTK